MEYLKIHDWDDFQQYKDDRPLHWIKLHVAVLDNYKISQITDEEFGQIAKIWLLAARMKNKIPNDPQWVKEKASLAKKPDLSKFIRVGFLELNGSVESRTVSYEAPPKSVPRGPYLEKRREDI